MSEKTIADKMYLKNAKSIAVLNAGAHPAAAAHMPPELIVGDDEPADVVLMFALNRAELLQWFPQALARLGDKGALWIAYMKQSAPKATDIHRDSISAYAKEQGASAVAIISLDADWSALRLKRL
jgi:hypothetical protein